MKNTTSRIKLLCTLAILVIVGLFVIIGFQLVSIHKKRNELALREAELQKIRQELAYYENQNPGAGDNDIVVGE